MRREGHSDTSHLLVWALVCFLFCFVFFFSVVYLHVGVFWMTPHSTCTQLCLQNHKAAYFLLKGDLRLYTFTGSWTKILPICAVVWNMFEVTDVFLFLQFTESVQNTYSVGAEKSVQILTHSVTYISWAQGCVFSWRAKQEKCVCGCGSVSMWGDHNTCTEKPTVLCTIVLWSPLQPRSTRTFYFFLSSLFFRPPSSSMLFVLRDHKLFTDGAPQYASIFSLHSPVHCSCSSRHNSYFKTSMWHWLSQR